MNQAEMNSVLQGELDGRGPCLDVGIGTGKLALGLAGAGLAVVGVDTSVQALSHLAESGAALPLRLVGADATALPFLPASFGSAVCSLVFHLIADWPRAVAELVRAVRPGGVILVAQVEATVDPLAERGGRYVSAASGRDQPVGVRDGQALAAAFQNAGARARNLSQVVEEFATDPEQIIRQLEAGQRARQPDLGEEGQHQMAMALRVWARAQFGSLDQPIIRQRIIAWRAFDLNG